MTFESHDRAHDGGAAVTLRKESGKHEPGCKLDYPADITVGQKRVTLTRTGGADVAHLVYATQVTYHPVDAWPVGQCLFCHDFSFSWEADGGKYATFCRRPAEAYFR